MEKMAYTADATPNATIKSGDQRLRSIVDRIVRLETEKAELSDDIRDIFKEAKSAGYDVKALRSVVRRQRETAEQAEARRLTESTVEMMEAALGHFGDSDLGRAAIESVRKAVDHLDKLADQDDAAVTLSGGGITIPLGKKARTTRADARAATEIHFGSNPL